MIRIGASPLGSGERHLGFGQTNKERIKNSPWRALERVDGLYCSSRVVRFKLTSIFDVSWHDWQVAAGEGTGLIQTNLGSLHRYSTSEPLNHLTTRPMRPPPVRCIRIRMASTTADPTVSNCDDHGISLAFVSRCLIQPCRSTAVSPDHPGMASFHWCHSSRFLAYLSLLILCATVYMDQHG